MALLLAIPKYRHIYFAPAMVNVADTEHGIVGLSSLNHGVKYPLAVSGLIHSQMVEVLDMYAQAMHQP